MHIAAPAVDDGRCALRLCGKTDRCEGVAMRAGAVARIEYGEGADKVRGRHRLPAEAGLTRIRARRSMSSIDTSAPARSVNGSMSRQRQISGGSWPEARPASASETDPTAGAGWPLPIQRRNRLALWPPRRWHIFVVLRLRQLLIDVGLVDDDMLDEHPRLDFVALEVGRHERRRRDGPRGTD